MRTDPIGGTRLKRLAGCSRSRASRSPRAAAAASTASAAAPSAAPATTAPSAAVAPSASANDKTLEIAYLSFAVANSYDAPMLAAAKAAAAAGNAKLTVFDANLDPGRPGEAAPGRDRVRQVRRDHHPAAVRRRAWSRTSRRPSPPGITVGNIDQVLGADMTTADFQVEGISSNVAFVPSELGKKIGDLVVTACADLKADAAHPCNVGYIWSVKAAALDIALKKAFDEAIASHPEIKVVSDTGESFYTTALGLKAAQDIVAAHPDVSVIVSADQAITGAVQAVKDIKDKVRLVGYGGGAVALQGIKSGERFGTVMQMPATEGGLGTKNLIDAIRSGTPVPGVDPLATLPDGGVVTKANVDTFLPLAEWPG